MSLGGFRRIETGKSASAGGRIISRFQPMLFSIHSRYRWETESWMFLHLQNDAALMHIRYFLNRFVRIYLEENQLDVVSGWRKNRKDTIMKKFTSRGANLLRGIIVKDHIHDSGCSLKVYRRKCFEGVTLYGEMHRFIPALLKIKGFTVGEVVVNHRPRTEGVTKYNWRRTFKGFVDMVSVWFWNKYSTRPLHMDRVYQE